jgi:hypothetical protein
VALRVPYTLEYQQRYLASLPKQKGLDIITIGHSAEGRPLTLIKIGRGDEQAEKENPCILMYAREHCDEPDSSWAVQGALRFLISNTPEAEQIRQKFTFLLIPMLDPDGWARGVHEGIWQSFGIGSARSLESASYLAWLKNIGGRVRLVFDLHNPEPNRWQHIMCERLPTDGRRLALGKELFELVVQDARSAAYAVHPLVAQQNAMAGRLCGRVAAEWGSVSVLYEVSSQWPAHRLFVGDGRGLRDLGVVLLRAGVRLLPKEFECSWS